MSTGVLIAVIALVVLVIAGGVVLAARNRAGSGNVQRRFGPEYDRVLAAHNGDTRAAENELSERVRRHDSLQLRDLPAATQREYTDRWSAAQELFVDAPQRAVAEVEQLLSALAAERGFPAADDPEQQTEALSVHHPRHVHGLRAVRTAVRNQGGTEELREAMLQARHLFEALMPTGRRTSTRRTTKGSETA